MHLLRKLRFDEYLYDGDFVNASQSIVLEGGSRRMHVEKGTVGTLDDATPTAGLYKITWRSKGELLTAMTRFDQFVKTVVIFELGDAVVATKKMSFNGGDKFGKSVAAGSVGTIKKLRGGRANVSWKHRELGECDVKLGSAIEKWSVCGTEFGGVWDDEQTKNASSQ